MHFTTVNFVEKLAASADVNPVALACAGHNAGKAVKALGQLS